MNNSTQLPNELLYIIIAQVFCDYFDDVVAGPYALPRQHHAGFTITGDDTDTDSDDEEDDGGEDDNEADDNEEAVIDADNMEGAENLAAQHNEEGGDGDEEDDGSTTGSSENEDKRRELETAEELLKSMRSLEDPASNAVNPMAALLQASTRIRAVSLEVLSDALRIPVAASEAGMQR